MDTAGSKSPARPAVKAGPANSACVHWRHENLVWALGSCRESPSGGLTHLPAIPSSLSSFQDIQHCILAGKHCSHNLGTAQETLTGFFEEASRVADIILQIRCWKFTGEHLWLHHKMIWAKKRPGHSCHQFPMSGVLCHMYFKNSLWQFVRKMSEWMRVYLDCL